MFFSLVETQYVEASNEVYDDWVAANNVSDQIPDWDLNEPMYAVRFINNNGAITTAMTFEKGKVRGDDFDITSARTTVAWGRHRKKDSLTREEGLFNSTTNAPGNRDISISINISLDGLTNNFIDSQIKQLNWIVDIPFWADTATPMEIILSGEKVGGGSGDIEFQFILASYQEGDILDGSSISEVSKTMLLTTSVVNRSLITISAKLDISSFVPGNKIVIKFIRDARNGNANDTFAGDFSLVDATLEYTRKRLG